MARAVAFVVASLFCIAAISIWGQAQKQQKKAPAQKETFTRPKPTKPIKPSVPSANRYQEDKVFLENADSLYRPKDEYEEFQVVKGNVCFRHGSMFMYCDSAFYYPEKNSMDAFGHVKMSQGDTLFVFSDKLYYDGTARHATLVKGPSRPDVQLKNRNVTLTTDSLDYDLNTEMGWYTTGGRLEDDVNTLTSIYGEYSPATKLARFRNDVLLVNRKDGYRMITEELDYNTGTHIANINQPTMIEGANDTIITSQGWYDTRTDHAQLTSRSTILHADSSRNITTLEGDSIIYDKHTRISRAYMFRDPAKQQRPMVLTDTARKVQLIGGYGEYNDSTRMALSADYPLLIEYSRPDTLFLRADTILSLIVTEMVWPDSLATPRSAELRARLRAFSGPQEMADSMHITLRLLPPDLPRPSSGSSIPIEVVEEREEIITDRTDRKSPTSPTSPISPTSLTRPISPTSLTRPISPTSPTDTLKRLDALGRDSAFMVPKDFHVAKALKRARFFNNDLQGIADTLIFRERDSLLFMIRKPVVWSGERQVYGNLIKVHFNDSTADWAHLPESGMVAEHVDEDFYNQLSGSDLKAWFKDQSLKHLEVEGNVQTIILPQENDSTYNKLVNAESSYLTVDMNGNKMEHMKMWPEVTGSVIPLFEIKKADQFIEGFHWLEALRPKREWYGDQVRWLDELGDVPDELDQYFNEAPIVRKRAKSPFSPIVPK